MNMTVEDIALEVYAICRERSNSTKKCLERISKEIIKTESSINDSQLEDKIRRYRESYKGLEELSKYILDKSLEVTCWKISL